MTLMEVFTKVPASLEACVSSWNPRGLGVRALRLVCKDSATIALRAVRLCTLQIGCVDGALPDVHRMAVFLAYTTLNELDLTLILWAGACHPDKLSFKDGLARQLKTCNSHTQHLVKCLGPSKHSLQYLHLTVRLIWHDQPKKVCIVDSRYDNGSRANKYHKGFSLLHSESATGTTSLKESCPPELVPLQHKVFALLAAAVPNLQHLSILGHCHDAALETFGSKCSHLSSLTVEMSCVPFQTIHNLPEHLPQLSSLHMMRRESKGNDLVGITEKVLCVIAPCSSLKRLNLDYGSCVEARAEPEVWQALASSLRELLCLCSVQGLYPLTPLLGNLQVLALKNLPETNRNLVKLLGEAPCLQELTLWQSKQFVHLDVSGLNTDANSTEFTALQQRLSTMKISTYGLQITASCTEVRALLSCLHPINSTELKLTITHPQHTTTDFLELLPQKFPTLVELDLVDRVYNAGPLLSIAGLSEDCLRPLMECKTLERLVLRIHFSFTNAGVSLLCFSLPVLEVFKCFRCEGLDVHAMITELHNATPACQVTMLHDR